MKIEATCLKDAFFASMFDLEKYKRNRWYGGVVNKNPST